MILYHGTSAAQAPRIRARGLVDQRGHRNGKVYLTSDREIAWCFAAWRLGLIKTPNTYGEALRDLFAMATVSLKSNIAPAPGADGTKLGLVVTVDLPDGYKLFKDLTARNCFYTYEPVLARHVIGMEFDRPLKNGWVRGTPVTRFY